MDNMMSRFEAHPDYMTGQSGAWEQSGAAQQAWHEPAQRAQHVQQQAQHAQQQAQHAQQQAQRLYHQQLMQQQEQYRSQQRPAMHSNFDAFQGYNNGLDSFAWDRQEVPNSFSPFDDLQAPSHRNIQASTQHDVHPSMLARQTLAARPYPKDPTRHDLGPSLSLPSSSGTPRSGAQKAGQGGGGGSRRKAKQKKGPSGDSSVMQRCLEVIEQLLEEEDAEPFAEPVDAKALGLDDYHDVIRQPMDLGTIKERLTESPPAYHNAAEVLKDVQQVWSNCRTYNDDDDAIIDMCDNMERFFYQAWKQEGLPLFPGAGPALSRARSGRGQTSTSGRHQEVDQHDTKHDQHRHAHTYEDDGLGDPSSPAQQSNRSKAQQSKHQRASLATVGSSQDYGGSSKKRTRPGSAPHNPPPAPAPYQESEKEKEAERKDQEAVKAWEKLQQQQRKAHQLIQAAQEAVLRMNEAKSALEGVQKSVTEAEAAQAAAEALRPWPSDARLVPPDYPLYPPSTPQRLHPDVATLGSYFFGLSSPSATEGPSSPHPGAQMRQELDQATGVDIIMPEATDGAGRHAEIEDEAQHDMSQQGTLDNVAEPEGSHRPDEGMTEEQGVESNAGEVLQAKDDTGVEKSADMQTNVTGWQRRVQSGWDEKQLQQIIQASRSGQVEEPSSQQTYQ